MIFQRVRSYNAENGKWTGCEQLYLGTDQVKALERFAREYQEHSKCICIAEYYDSEEPKNKEHFESCKRCGCVN